MLISQIAPRPVGLRSRKQCFVPPLPRLEFSGDLDEFIGSFLLLLYYRCTAFPSTLPSIEFGCVSGVASLSAPRPAPLGILSTIVFGIQVTGLRQVQQVAAADHAFKITSDPPALA